MCDQGVCSLNFQIADAKRDQQSQLQNCWQEVTTGVRNWKPGLGWLVIFLTFVLSFLRLFSLTYGNVSRAEKFATKAKLERDDVRHVGQILVWS